MQEYREQDLLRLAKRYRNSKRSYLLVDPLQGKHIPVSPQKALTMMSALGQKLAQLAPETDLVISFAETATAVGAAVAACLPDGCHYIHTTREPFACTGHVLSFQEEHSHATDQYLLGDHLSDLLRRARAVAFVDDEISTGKTLLNFILALRQACDGLQDKPIYAVSIINRLGEDALAAFAAQGIRCCSLLQLPLTDYSKAVAPYEIRGAGEVPEGQTPVSPLTVRPKTGEARHGVAIREYVRQCDSLAAQIADRLGERLRGKRVTVLGTEEYMYPGLVLGRKIEEMSVCPRVDYHATTRSPIGLCTADGYPIRSGYRLHSFYDRDRCTFIYNLLPTDIAIIMTDSPDEEAVAAALRDLSAAFSTTGCQEIILIREAIHVRDIQAK